tara:strand:+ start:4325 stop:4804 length:480 start_codon:yes stop_codon:yes gene_type:complete
MEDNETKIEEFGQAFVPKMETPDKVLKRRMSHRAKIEGQVKFSKERFTPTIVSGINKLNVEMVLKRDVPDDTTMPLWKNGKLTGSVIKKVWDIIDRDLIVRLASGWKVKPKPGYNKTTYYVNLKGDCSCQGYKVRNACSHALAIDVFVHLDQMGCIEQE